VATFITVRRELEMFGSTENHDSGSVAEGTVLVPDTIPLFPLPRTVLLPGELLPLHVFEERYRAMVREAVVGHRVIGVVAVAPGHEGEHLGAPPLQEVGCVGFVAQHRELDDGRFLIWLVGLEVFRIDQELDSSTPYRLARVTYLTGRDSASELAGIQPLRTELRSLLPGLVDSDEEARRSMAEQLGDVTDTQLVALASHVLELPFERKQLLLETSSVADRFMLVYEDLYARGDTEGLDLDESEILN